MRSNAILVIDADRLRLAVSTWIPESELTCRTVGVFRPRRGKVTHVVLLLSAKPPKASKLHW